MREVYIVDAVRTPVGRMGGTLKNTQAHEMGGLVCKALMERTGLAPELVEEVVIAQVKQNAVASNIARVCALMAGFREEIPAYTLMMQCGSSLQSVNCAANDIRCGDVDVAVAGGVAANSRIRADLEAACARSGDRLYLPRLSLCGDNGAMIGCQGYYEYLAGRRAGMDLNAYANRDIQLG